MYKDGFSDVLEEVNAHLKYVDSPAAIIYGRVPKPAIF